MNVDRLQPIPTKTRRLVIAYSGGLDSTVLLHLAIHHYRDLPVVAWHVNHGLQQSADDMEQFCLDTAEAFDVPLRVDRLQLDRFSGNLEALARQARYQLFQQNSQAGDCILTAHHQGDQAETFLLNLLRGSGVRGLRGIAATRALGPAALVRPLLEIPRQQIRDYAAEHGLSWFDDPSNDELGFNRNYLRHQVIPVLSERWPSAEQKISDSCRWQYETQELLDEFAAEDLQNIEVASEWGAALDITKLSQLTQARCRNLLRHWLVTQNVRVPPASRLQTLMHQITGDSAAAEITMPDYQLKTFDHKLFLVTDSGTAPVDQGYFEFDQAATFTLPGDQTQWSRQQVFERFAIEDLQQTLSIGFRETVADTLVSRHHLKHFFQERSVPPWVRASLPLVFIDQKLSGYLL